MVQYYPSPYTLKWSYTVSNVTHRQQLCVNVTNSPVVGSTFLDAVVTQKNGATVSLDAFCDNFFGVYKALFNTTVVIGDLELWKNYPNSYDMSFVSAGEDTYTGTNGSTFALSYYGMYTFRSENGNVFKLLALELSKQAENQQAYSALTAPEKAVVDFVKGSQNAFLARDNGFPVSFIRASFGQNEKVWRKRNRINS